MFCCVHQGNLHITAVPSKLTKYAQKTLYTKTPLSRGLIGKTLPDTEKKNEKTTKSNTDLDRVYLRQPSKTRCFREAYTGLPVVRATENQKALNCVVLKYSIPVSEE